MEMKPTTGAMWAAERIVAYHRAMSGSDYLTEGIAHIIDETHFAGVDAMELLNYALYRLDIASDIKAAIRIRAALAKATQEKCP